MQNSFHSTVEILLDFLNPKEKYTILKRFNLDNEGRHTLEKIGQHYGITRERVRQIEKNGLTKLARIVHTTELKNLEALLLQTLEDSGYCLSEKLILEQILEAHPKLKSYKNLLVLCLAVNHNIVAYKNSQTVEQSWFFKHKITKKKIDHLHQTALLELKKHNKIISQSQLVKTLKKTTGLNQNLIIATLFIFKDIQLTKTGYGLSTWRNVTPRSIRDKALIVLNEANKPLHFRQIATLIQQLNHKKTVTVQAVHNELIRYKDFVLIGRGIYALRDWGFTEGTVKDVLFEILSASGGPMKKTKIIEEVLKRRHVKIGTVSLNLQKYPEFKRIGRATYTV